jgi:hypothetical protein
MSMIPQVTGVSVTSMTVAPNLDVSMTTNITTSLGRNKINRIAHSMSVFYPGNAQNDSTVELEAATLSTITGLPEPVPYVLTLPSPTKALVIAVQCPIVAVLTVNNAQLVIPVTKVLHLDAPVARIELRNEDTTRSAQAILTYIV